MQTWESIKFLNAPKFCQFHPVRDHFMFLAVFFFFFFLNTFFGDFQLFIFFLNKLIWSAFLSSCVHIRVGLFFNFVMEPH